MWSWVKLNMDTMQATSCEGYGIICDYASVLGKERRLMVMVETRANWAVRPKGLLRMGTGDVIPGMRALPAELRDRPGVP